MSSCVSVGLSSGASVLVRGASEPPSSASTTDSGALEDDELPPLSVLSLGGLGLPPAFGPVVEDGETPPGFAASVRLSVIVSVMFLGTVSSRVSWL